MQRSETSERPDTRWAGGLEGCGREGGDCGDVRSPRRLTHVCAAQRILDEPRPGFLVGGDRCDAVADLGRRVRWLGRVTDRTTHLAADVVYLLGAHCRDKVLAHCARRIRAEGRRHEPDAPAAGAQSALASTHALP